MTLNNFWKFVISVAITEGAGLIGAVFTTPSINGWYSGLEKAALNPPSWVFGPVWTTLFFLMGVALYLVWTHRDSHPKEKNRAFTVFAVQLMLNILWSILFFGLHSPFLALVCIIFLWVAIVFTILEFRSFSRTAGRLLLPYLLWVTFAIYLNYSVWVLNR